MMNNSKINWNADIAVNHYAHRLLNISQKYPQKIPENLILWLQQLCDIDAPEHITVLDIGLVKIDEFYYLNDSATLPQIDEVNRCLEHNLSKHLLAIASDEVGNQFAINLNSEKYGVIYYWDHETNELFYVAKDIKDFYNKLFDEKLDPLSLEDILRKDDTERLAEWLKVESIHKKNEEGITAIEEAAIHGSTKCIAKLHELGAPQLNSIQYAEKNLQYFEDHQETVDLLYKLYGEVNTG